MSHVIDSTAELEAIVGKPPLPVVLKVIDHLDDGARRWVQASSVMFCAFGDEAGVAMTFAGGAPGFADAGAGELRLPVALLDDPSLALVGKGFASLLPLPGITETLRINGKVTDVTSGEVRIAVEECYGHCGKALLRSNFWMTEPIATAPSGVSAFGAKCRFMALATVDAQGRADLSPKGDPAGMMVHLDGARLWFADRPGNRRVDSFRNIIAQPRVAAALLIPGSPCVMKVSGTASIADDEVVRARFRVQDKTPALAIRIDELDIAMSESPALVRAWSRSGVDRPAGIDPAKIFAEHIKHNKANGLGARLASVALSVPGVTGLLKKGLERDYRDNL